MSCDQDHSEISHKGLQKRSNDWQTFSIDYFLENTSLEQQKAFLCAMDYHLFFALETSTSYKERSLVDHFCLLPPEIPDAKPADRSVALAKLMA